MVESGNQLSYEWSSGSLREPLLFEVAPDVGQQFSSFRYLGHQAVEIVRLHGLVQPDDVRVSEPPHQLCLPKKVLPDIVFFDLVCFNDLYGNLQCDQLFVKSA